MGPERCYKLHRGTRRGRHMCQQSRSHAQHTEHCSTRGELCRTSSHSSHQSTCMRPSLAGRYRGPRSQRPRTSLGASRSCSPCTRFRTHMIHRHMLRVLHNSRRSMARAGSSSALRKNRLCNRTYLGRCRPRDHRRRNPCCCTSQLVLLASAKAPVPKVAPHNGFQRNHYRTCTIRRRTHHDRRS